MKRAHKFGIVTAVTLLVGAVSFRFKYGSGLKPRQDRVNKAILEALTRVDGDETYTQFLEEV